MDVPADPAEDLGLLEGRRPGDLCGGTHRRFVADADAFRGGRCGVALRTSGRPRRRPVRRALRDNDGNRGGRRCGPDRLVRLTFDFA